MRHKITALLLDIASATTVGFGVAILLLPFVLFLGLGADNDAYVVIAEWAGGKSRILLQFRLEPMFRLDFLLWPALLIAIGLLFRYLPRRWLAGKFSTPTGMA